MVTVRPAYVGTLCCMVSLVLANAAVYGRFAPLVIWLVAVLVTVVYGREVR